MLAELVGDAAFFGRQLGRLKLRPQVLHFGLTLVVELERSFHRCGVLPNDDVFGARGSSRSCDSTVPTPNQSA